MRGCLLAEMCLIAESREFGGADIRFGASRSGLNPLLQDFDFVVGQLAVRRHLQVFVVVQHSFGQQRCSGVIGHHCSARISTDQPAAFAIQQQSAFARLGFLRMVSLFDLPLRQSHGSVTYNFAINLRTFAACLASR